MDDTHRRIALYTRVSSDNQALKVEGSLEEQEDSLQAALDLENRNPVDGRPGAITAVFREEGESGKDTDRPQLQRLLGAVRAGQVDAVWVTKVDRLSRSLRDFMDIHDALQSHGVRFRSLRDKFDTSEPMGRAMLQLILVFAELERAQTAERTRVSMASRARRGLWNGGHPVLGYDSVGDGFLEVNKDEAEVVRLAFDRMLEVRSATKVSRWLNESGFRQKDYESRRRGKAGGRRFTRPVVVNMLRNRIYLGEVKHKDEWFAGRHQPIIEERSFELVGEILEANKRGTRPGKSAIHDFVLTGLLRCGVTGYALTSSTARGRGKKYPYYRRVQKEAPTDDTEAVTNIAAADLEEIVLAVVEAGGQEPEVIEGAVEAANRIARDEAGPRLEQLDQLRVQLREAEREGERMLDQLLGLGLADSSTGKRRLTELESRQDDLRRGIARLEGELAALEGRELNARLLVEALQDFRGLYARLTADERKDMLRLLIHHIDVWKGRLDVHFLDGRDARVRLDELRAADLRENPKPQNAEKRTANRRFAFRIEWLPGTGQTVESCRR